MARLTSTPEGRFSDNRNGSDSRATSVFNEKTQRVWAFVGDAAPNLCGLTCTRSCAKQEKNVADMVARDVDERQQTKVLYLAELRRHSTRNVDGKCCCAPVFVVELQWLGSFV